MDEGGARERVMDRPFEQIFPFGFPPATQLYLILYVVTLLGHVVFMNYVLAGVILLALRSFLSKRENLSDISKVLIDWLPAALSMAITFGVAPLLFVQVLYRQNFYTANLLLSHRWMAVLPALILGFYLLYILKSKATSAHLCKWLQPILIACFAFVAWSWSENHLLSLQSVETWTRHYAQQRLWFWRTDLAARWAIWVCGSFSTLGILLGWQLRFAERSNRRACRTLFLCGYLFAGFMALLYAFTSPDFGEIRLLGSFLLPYSILAITGFTGAAFIWLRASSDRAWSLTCLVGTSLCHLAGMVGVVVIREAIRLRAINPTTLYAQHEEQAAKAGLWVFVICSILIGMCITWALRAVWRANKKWETSE